METALLEPNTAETNDSVEATRLALSTAPTPVPSISLPSEVSSQPMATEVTENLLMETERGFQQEVKHHETGQNDLKHAATLVTNQ